MGRLAGIACGMLAALVAGACALGAGMWLQHRAAERESERLGLLWNSYASAQYRLAGSWQPVGQAMAADWERFRQLGTSSLAIWEADGATPVLAYGETGGPAAGRALPVIVDGRIVGYTSAEIGGRPDRAVFLFPAAAVLATGGLWAFASARWRKAAAKPLRAIARKAAELAAEPGRGETAGSGADPGDALEALDRLALRIHRLETVRSTMVADIAHELRTPLAVMRAQLEQALLAGTALPPDKLATLHDETYRMSKLVRDMQELSLAESGRLRLEKRWCRMAELLGGVVDALGLEAEERGIAVKLDAPQELMAYADPVRLQQIVVNLVGNAIRHARSAVSVSAALSGRDRIRVTVSDDGFGIEEEELPRVFERFYRGSGPRQGRKEGGLGLGLAIAKEYAAAHGGRLEAASRWGEGAVFTLELPVMKQD